MISEGILIKRDQFISNAGVVLFAGESTRATETSQTTAMRAYKQIQRCICNVAVGAKTNGAS